MLGERSAGRCRAAHLLVAIVVMVAALWVHQPAAHAAAAGDVTLISHVPSGPATTSSVLVSDPYPPWQTPLASAHGEYVTFVSTATDLVSGQVDTNGTWDVFLFHRPTSTVTLVSHAAGSPTTAANAKSEGQSISASGAFVVFYSRATNLVTGQVDSAGSDDVFLFSRATGAVTLVSHTSSSAVTAAQNFSALPSMSSDGAFVTFRSGAINLVAGQIDPVVTHNSEDIFLFSRATGEVTLVSHTPGSALTTVNGTSFQSYITADGSHVAFTSMATNAVTGQVDTADTQDVFLYSRNTGVVTLVSHRAGSASTAAGADSYVLARGLSADGRFVAFLSRATDLVPGQVDTNGYHDAFLFPLDTGAVTLISHVAGQPTTTGMSYAESLSVSADGSLVSFLSGSIDLLPGPWAPTSPNAFLFARATGAVTLVSHSPAGATTYPNGYSVEPVMTVDGAFISFTSVATNLVPGQVDTEGTYDAFLWSRASDSVALVSHAAGSALTATGKTHPQSLAVNPDGSFVAFASTATDLVAGQVDTNGGFDSFLYQRSVSTPIARRAADLDGDGDSDVAVLRPSTTTWYARGGATVPFGLAGDIPVPCDYDGNGSADIAVFRPSAGAWLTQGQPTVFLGGSGDVPVPADYDGDGDCDVAVFRPSVGGWYRAAAPPVFFGLSGDIPVPADFDGDGRADITVFRPSVGGWYHDGAATIYFGLNNDIPVPSDFDGDGVAEVAVFRPTFGAWYVNGQTTQFLGLSGDIPVPGDYDGDGVDDRAVFRPATGGWFVGAQAPVFFGLDGDRPLPLPSAVRQVFFP